MGNGSESLNTPTVGHAPPSGPSIIARLASRGGSVPGNEEPGQGVAGDRRASVCCWYEEVRAMIEVVASKQAELEALREQYSVRRLALFGSAAKGTWRQGTSDLDFLVDIGDYDDQVGRRFMGFLTGLERLFGDNFDVVSEPAVKSGEFRAELERTAVTLFDQQD
jgi:predicted nucleotidyltransferase